MALIDFNNKDQFNSLNLSEYSATIIGCGAVGIFIAKKLSKNGIKSLIIESGTLSENEFKQALNESILNRSDLEGSVHWGRKRVVGGTTLAWGGQALPFTKIDFQNREWLSNDDSKWNLSLDDLTPNYREAEAYLGVSNVDYYLYGLKKLGLIDPLKSDKFNYHLSKWANQPNMFKKYKNQIEATGNIDVLYNAHCIGVKNENNTCVSIEISDEHKNSACIPINKLYLANGGIESVRFLLLHYPKCSEDLGNGFMEHPCMKCGEIISNKKDKLQKVFGVKLYRFKRYSLRLSLSNKLMIDSKLANASFSIMFDSLQDEFDPYKEVKRLSKAKFLLEGIKNISSLKKTIYFLLRYKTIFRTKPGISIVVMSEQLWSKENSLSLDENSFDRFNQPKLKVNWKIDATTINSVKIGYENLKLEMMNAFPDISNIQDSINFNSISELDFSPVNHHMGGATIGKVVDKNLKINGINNLFVCSSAIFPTSSHSNPTLTTLALVSKMLDENTEIN
jgi:choline dehydrogenase-like flavoprotein